jgi:HD-GYP domain-containing protein (c-di-GMP phosphodiesterase class II)
MIKAILLKNLKGDKICRNARIVMIADVVDAITSGRPYKPVQEMDAAIKILRSDEGKYSKEFVSVLEKILE